MIVPSLRYYLQLSPSAKVSSQRGPLDAKSTLSPPINERVSQSIIVLKDLKERESKSS
jgi:hypothetical protein